MFRNSGLHGLWILVWMTATIGCGEVEDIRARVGVGVGVSGGPDSATAMVLPPTGSTGSTGSMAQSGGPTRAMSSMRPSDASGALGVPNRTQQTILIASFNIQAFGVKKVTDPVVVDRIVLLGHVSRLGLGPIRPRLVATRRTSFRRGS